MALGTAVIEKDFWVCWTLKLLFALGTTPARLILREERPSRKSMGLSSGFQRTSTFPLTAEDLGFVGEHDPYAARGKKAKALVEEIVAFCRVTIVRELGLNWPNILNPCSGPADGANTWNLESDDANAQTMYFRYPAGVGSGGSFRSLSSTGRSA